MCVLLSKPVSNILLLVNILVFCIHFISFWIVWSGARAHALDANVPNNTVFIFRCICFTRTHTRTNTKSRLDIYTLHRTRTHTQMAGPERQGKAAEEKKRPDKRKYIILIYYIGNIICGLKWCRERITITNSRLRHDLTYIILLCVDGISQFKDSFQPMAATTTTTTMTKKRNHSLRSTILTSTCDISERRKKHEMQSTKEK